jgi:hypothetical protein
MGNFLTLVFVTTILGISMFIGSSLDNTPAVTHRKHTATVNIPHIGRVQILNGCGIDGAAGKVADFLRSNNFDIKSIGNAETWNYPSTMVISRTLDTTVACQVAKALKTKNMVIIRNNDNLHDVTVLIGPDFRERTQ